MERGGERGRGRGRERKREREREREGELFFHVASIIDILSRIETCEKLVHVIIHAFCTTITVAYNIVPSL